MLISSWLKSFRSRLQTSPRRLRRKRVERSNGQTERLEDKALLTSPLLETVYLPRGEIFIENDVIETTPTQITLEFDAGQAIDAATANTNTITVERAGADDLFGTLDDTFIAISTVTVNPIPDDNQVVFQFGEQLDSGFYRIRIEGNGTDAGGGAVTPLRNTAQEAFNNGADGLFHFEVDLPDPTLVALLPNEGDFIDVTGASRTILNLAPNELTLRFNPGQQIDPETINGETITLVRAGFDGDLSNGTVPVTLGYVGIGDVPEEVVVRFAENLPDDIYRLTLDGASANPIMSLIGETFNGGMDFSVDFELDLGARIVAIDPQPVTRNPATGLLEQARDQIVVYFNEDELDAASAANRSFYQLIFTNDTVSNIDDVHHIPIPGGVVYDAVNHTATLTFADDISALSSGPGTYRLRIGTAELKPQLPLSHTPGTDPGSSYATANNQLGVISDPGNTSHTFSSAIDPQFFPFDFPGNQDEPGHREIEVETHVNAGPDATSGASKIDYNFRDVYGVDPQGNVLHNLITEAQKERAREIFEFYSNLLGIDFRETASSGLTIVTGDLRALDPTIPTGPGGVGGLAGGGTAIMDSAESWTDHRGGGWFSTAMHEIGHLLGLGHSYELPERTVQGADGGLDAGRNVSNEPDFPGDADIVHGRLLHRLDGVDIDLYRFEVQDAGLFTAEVIAERLANSSQLDAVVRLFRENADGSRELISQNDDYFSEDSFISLDLDPGVYFVGISSTGNDAYDPTISDTGINGTSDGQYDLRINFRPDVDVSIVDTTGVAFDGDSNGVAGGVYNFWFRAVDSADTIYVDKSAAGGGNGSLGTPFRHIRDATAVAQPGQIIRIVGNGGADGDILTTDDNLPYQIGFNTSNQPLEDGSTLEIPQGVTVMVDGGAVFKMRRSLIGVGSSSTVLNRSAGALQILGTPEHQVIFTSWSDETIGTDTSLIPTTPQEGDWGGIVFRNNVDRAQNQFNFQSEGIFLNYVGHSSIQYGGGNVVVDSVLQTINPIHVTQAQPTIVYNRISESADSAMSADPDSFEEITFHSPRFQEGLSAFTSDYTRVGPDIYGNTLVSNSTNGLFVRVVTPAGGATLKMTVPGRFDDLDVVHVIAQNLEIQGTPGGPFRDTVAPQVTIVSQTVSTGGNLPFGLYSYRIVFVDENGFESPASAPTPQIFAPSFRRITLGQLPVAASPYTGRRIYRSRNGGPYELVAELDKSATTYVDDGASLGKILNAVSARDRARINARLAIDPGVIVKLEGARIETGIGAQLIAEGFNGREVIFTSRLDDRYGAGGTFDTNDDGDLISRLNVLFSDSFEAGIFDPALWVNSSTVTIDDVGLGEPSPTVSARFNQDPGGTEFLQSVSIDLSGETHAAIDYFFQKTGGGDAPEAGDNLILEYRNAAGTWVSINTHLGADPDMTTYESASVMLPTAALHTNFAFRFRTTAQGSMVGDDWFVDNVVVRQARSAATPTPGNWGGIYIGHMGSASIDRSLITFAGGITPHEGDFAAFNAVEIHQASARIRNTVFEDNADGRGGTAPANRFNLFSNAAGTIFVRGAQPVILNNEFRNNDGPVININTNALNSTLTTDPGRSTGYSDHQTAYPDNQGPLIRDNAIGGNEINGMNVRGETLTTQSVWDDTDIVHVLTNEVYIPDLHTSGGLRLESSPTQSLVVKLSGSSAGFSASGEPLDIVDRIGGMLHIIGQPGRPVVLTSLADDSVGAGFDLQGLPLTDTNNDGNSSLPMPGDWESVSIEQYAHDRNVDVYIEREIADALALESNEIVSKAEVIGQLAADQKSGDENLRLGFEVLGTIDNPGDIDIYSFSAVAGSQIWLDIDRSTQTLDSVVELLDGNGNILALSDNTLDEELGNWSVVARADIQAFTLDYSQYNSDDMFTLNALDAGMRVILPGTAGVRGDYFVRVRSSNLASSAANRADLEDVTKIGDGLTSGAYQLQVRLQELDEFAGTTVQFADIRYAVRGVDITGQPIHSPLAGESEEVEGNNSDVTSNQLGNLMDTDRAVLAVRGEISTDTDIDYFSFEVNYDSTQQIGGVSLAGPHVPVTFDIDYADGLARADLTLAIFDSSGDLILIGRDSNVAEDQPGPTEGADLDDLSRGSVGKFDPFIGPVELPGGNYTLAISNNTRIPSVLDQYFTATPVQPLLRMEPVNSVERLAEERFEFPTGDPITTANRPITDLFNVVNSPNGPVLDARHAVPFNLSDVTLYVEGGLASPLLIDGHIFTVNPFTGARETVLGLATTTAGPQEPLGDLAMRPDGQLYSFTTGPNNGERTSAVTGEYVRIDTGNASLTELGDDGITTNLDNLTLQGNPATLQPTPTDNNVLDNNAGIIYEAMAFIGTGPEDLFAIGTRATVTPPANSLLVANYTTNVLYQFNSSTGAVVGAAADRVNDARAYDGAGTTQVEIGQVSVSGTVTGMAYVGGTMYAVTNTGGLYTVDLGSASTSLVANLGVNFAGLAAGPDEVENGLFSSTLFGISNTGELFAFDTAGNLSPVFVDGQTSVQTGVGAVSGLAFSTLDRNLWELTRNRNTDAGHGVRPRFDDSITSNGFNGGNSLYFGNTRSGQDAGNQNNLGAGAINDVNFPGGAHGAVISNNFSLEGYNRADKPVLYFNYFLDTEGVDYAPNVDLMRDSFRVYVGEATGEWHLVTTNDSFQSATQADEFDLGPDGRGTAVPTAQNFPDVVEAFDNAGWRQARVDLSNFAGRGNLKLRFEFSTAGSSRLGSLQTQGLEIRATAASELTDGDAFAYVDDLTTGDRTIFEFDLGTHMTVPTGAAALGQSFTIYGQTFRYVNTPFLSTHIGVLTTDTAEEVAQKTSAVVNANLGFLGFTMTVPDGTTLEGESFTMNGVTFTYTDTPLLPNDILANPTDTAATLVPRVVQSINRVFGVGTAFPNGNTVEVPGIADIESTGGTLNLSSVTNVNNLNLESFTVLGQTFTFTTAPAAGLLNDIAILGGDTVITVAARARDAINSVLGAGTALVDPGAPLRISIPDIPNTADAFVTGGTLVLADVTASGSTTNVDGESFTIFGRTYTFSDDPSSPYQDTILAEVGDTAADLASRVQAELAVDFPGQSFIFPLADNRVSIPDIPAGQDLYLGGSLFTSDGATVNNTEFNVYGRTFRYSTSGVSAPGFFVIQVNPGDMPGVVATKTVSAINSAFPTAALPVFSDLNRVSVPDLPTTADGFYTGSEITFVDVIANGMSTEVEGESFAVLGRIFTFRQVVTDPASEILAEVGDTAATLASRAATVINTAFGATRAVATGGILEVAATSVLFGETIQVTDGNGMIGDQLQIQVGPQIDTFNFVQFPTGGLEVVIAPGNSPAAVAAATATALTNQYGVESIVADGDKVLIGFPSALTETGGSHTASVTILNIGGTEFRVSDGLTSIGDRLTIDGVTFTFVDLAVTPIPGAQQFGVTVANTAAEVATIVAAQIEAFFTASNVAGTDQVDLNNLLADVVAGAITVDPSGTFFNVPDGATVIGETVTVHGTTFTFVDSTVTPSPGPTDIPVTPANTPDVVASNAAVILDAFFGAVVNATLTDQVILFGVTAENNMTIVDPVGAPFSSVRVNAVSVTPLIVDLLDSPYLIDMPLTEQEHDVPGTLITSVTRDVLSFDLLRVTGNRVTARSTGPGEFTTFSSVLVLEGAAGVRDNAIAVPIIDATMNANEVAAAMRQVIANVYSGGTTYTIGDISNIKGGENGENLINVIGHGMPRSVLRMDNTSAFQLQNDVVNVGGIPFRFTPFPVTALDVQSSSNPVTAAINLVNTVNAILGNVAQRFGAEVYFFNSRVTVQDAAGNGGIDLIVEDLIEDNPLAFTPTLPGDSFGVGNASFSPEQLAGAQRAQNNAVEGVYVDDIILGFAERGEMVITQSNAAANTGFTDNRDVLNPNYPAGQTYLGITVGEYDLEIRRASDYATTESSSPTNTLDRAIDTNDREAQLVSITLPSDSATVVDGSTITIADGVNSVVFQFIDENGNTPTQSGAFRIGFNPLTDGSHTLAAELRDAINSAIVQGILNVKANLSDNLDQGTSSTSSTVHLTNNATATASAQIAGLVTIENFNAFGDRNHHRDQGQLIIHSSFVTNAEEFGIAVDADTRTDPQRPHPGSVRNLREINTSRQVTGVVLSNNVVANNGSGGILFSGDQLNNPSGQVPYGRIVNNTIVGNGVGTGVVINDGASPTLLNNIIADFVVGMQITAASPTIGATLYRGNGTNVQGGGTGTFPIFLTANDPLFVDQANGNYYLAAQSPAIDSALDSLNDRSGLTTVKSPLGLGASPILAPDLDVFGQLRGDDPNAAPPAGQGANVFIDRGAVDRVDFFQPTAGIIDPLDQSAIDLDTDFNEVFVSGPEPVRSMTVRLFDEGVGIDVSNVNSLQFTLLQEGVPLVEGVGYIWVYNSAKGDVTFRSPTAFRTDRRYEIRVKNTPAADSLDIDGVRDLAGNFIAPNQADGTTRFFVTLSNGINDAPVNTVPADETPAIDQTVDEDTALVFSTALGRTISVYDDDVHLGTNRLTVTLTAVNGSVTLNTLTGINVSAGADGTDTITFDGDVADLNNALNGLTFLGSQDFVGTATLTVRTEDFGQFTFSPMPSEVDTDTIQIDVLPINDAPVFTTGTPPSSDEDAGAQTVNGLLTGIAPGPPTATDEAGQNVSFVTTVQSSTGTLAFTTAPSIDAAGNLTYEAAADTNGTATISVIAVDDGSGTAPNVNTSAAQTFVITVDPVNDAPQFTANTPAASDEDAGLVTVNGVLTDILPGPAAATDELSQTVTFTTTVTGTTGNLAFATAPSIDSAGNLTYETAVDTNGTATISVFATDDGPGSAPDVNTSAAQTFVITVNAVNDAPIFTTGTPPASDEDAGAQTVNGLLTGIAPGPATATDETGQTVSFVTTVQSSTGNLAFATAPSIDAAGNLTYEAAGDTNGTATISVIAVDDGSGTAPNVNTSAAQTFVITVNPVNDAPQFTANTPAASDEDAGDVTVNGVLTDILPGPAAATDELGQTVTFTTIVTATTGNLAFATGSAPSIDSQGNLTYRTAVDTNGTATVSVFATDDGSGTAPNVNTSAVQTFVITVNPVNDAPIFTTGTPPASNEDAGAQAVFGLLTGIAPGPATATDETGQNVSFVTAVQSSTGSLTFAAGPSIDAAGNLTYTAAADTSGTATISVIAVDDGPGTPPNINTSAAQTFVITVNPVNDAPQFTVNTPAAIDEDAGLVTVNGVLTDILPGPPAATDELSQTVSFTTTVTGTTGNLAFATAPSIDAAGNLTYETAVDTNGTATISVFATDDGPGTAPDVNTSAAQTFVITVNAVNDAPIFTTGTPPASDEDAGAQTVNGLLTGIAPGPPTATDEAGQNVSFVTTVQSSTGNLAFTTAPSIDAAGNLTYEAAADTNGTAIIQVIAVDDGPSAAPNVNTSAAQTFTLTVNPVNDAPEFILGTAPATDEDAGQQTVNAVATGIRPGPLTATDESGQVVTFTTTVVGTTGNLAFVSAPVIDASGNLTYTAAPDTNGTATLSVVLTDDGPGTAPDVNQSAAQSLTITVNAVNDAPVFTLGTAPVVNEDAGPQTVAGLATGIAPGPSTATDESGQSVSFLTTVLSTTGNLAFSVAPSVDASGNLTYTTAPDTNGTATISVVAVDDGPGTAPNVNTSAAQTLTLTVNAVNDAPVFTFNDAAFTVPAANRTVASNEDAVTQSKDLITSFASGPVTATDESGQALTWMWSAPTVTVGNVAFNSFGITVDGDLQYLTAPNTSGTATFDLWLVDNGPGVSPDVNASNPVTITINVIPQPDPPVPSTPVYVIDEGYPLQLDASGTVDLDIPHPGETLTFAWDLNNDGSFNDVVTTSPTFSVPYSKLQSLGLSAPSLTPVTLRVTDTFSGTSASISSSLTIRAVDYGDAPNSYGTLQTSNGAAHTLIGGFFLGSGVDSESTGQPSADATGDGSDEDGVVFDSLIQAHSSLDVPSFLTVTASSAGRIDAWIDWNGNGVFDGNSEHLRGGSSFIVAPGVNNLPFTVRGGTALTGVNTFARVRFSSGGGLAPTGRATNGEVEDYVVHVNQLFSPVSVERVLPRWSQTSDRTPVIQWRQLAGTQPGANTSYNVVVRNQNGDIVFTANRITSDSVEVVVPGGLPAGTYSAVVTPFNRAGVAGSDSALPPFQVVAIAVTAPSGDTASGTPTITWTPVAVTDRYELQVNSVSTGQTGVINRVNLPGNTPTFVVNSTLPIGTYQTRVRAIESVTGQVGDWSPFTTFAVRTPPVVTTPTGVIADQTPLVEWTSVPGATTYSLMITDLTDNRGVILNETGIATNSYHVQIPNDLPLGDFRIQVRAFNAQGESSFDSAPVPVTVKPLPQIVLPPSGLPGDPQTFRWDPLPGANVYDLEVVDQLTNQVVLLKTGLTGTRFTLPPADILRLGRYSFRIRGINNASNGSTTGPVVSEWSAPAVFTIVTAPPNVLTPSGVITDSTPLFQWTSVQKAVEYELRVDNLTTGLQRTVSVTNAVNTSVIAGIDNIRVLDGSGNRVPASELADGDYRVRVRAFADSAHSVGTEFSTEQFFTISASVPPAPVLTGVAPEDSSNPVQTASVRPRLTWQHNGGNVSYNFWLSSFSENATIHVVNGVQGGSLTAPVDLPVGRYRYWVQLVTESGDKSAWSPAYNFSVVTAPTLVGVPAATPNRTPTFNWTDLAGTVNGQPVTVDRWEVWLNNVTTTPATRVLRVTDVAAPTFTVPTNLAVGSYRVFVRGFSTGSNASAGTTTTLYSPGQTIEITNRPVLNNPGSSTDTTPELTWTPIQGAHTYEIFISRPASQQTAVVRTDGITSTSFSPVVPLAPDNYIAWVRAADADGRYGPWSRAVRFAVLDIGTPVLNSVTSPSGPRPTITWSSVQNAIGYEIYFSHPSTPTVAVLRVSNIASTSFTPTAPLAPNAYRVWVRAISEGNRFGAWSIAQDFTVVAADPDGSDGNTTHGPATVLYASLDSVPRDWSPDSISVTPVPAEIHDRHTAIRSKAMASQTAVELPTENRKSSVAAKEIPDSVESEETDDLMSNWDEAIWSAESAALPSEPDLKTKAGLLAGLAAFGPLLFRRRNTEED